MICNRADVGTPVTDTPGWSMPSPLPRRSGNGQRYLRAPPSNRLEKLKGERGGQYSIRINDQWRVCFWWADSGAEDVEIVDYH
jgi:RelE-like toxin of type II toxin-antitoxin system HigB